MEVFMSPLSPDSMKHFSKKNCCFSHERTIYLYKPLPMSWFYGIFGYLKGSIAQFAHPTKTIATGEGREGITSFSPFTFLQSPESSMLAMSTPNLTSLKKT